MDRSNKGSHRERAVQKFPFFLIDAGPAVLPFQRNRDFGIEKKHAAYTGSITEINVFLRGEISCSIYEKTEPAPLGKAACGCNYQK